MSNVNVIDIQDHAMWGKFARTGKLLSLSIEITARCNFNCRHCFINQSAANEQYKSTELSVQEINDLVDQAMDLGVLWVLLSGGEPLLRPDFEEIYLNLKRKGLLITVFTNAALIRQKHIDLFKKYPPRDIEITMYGATQETFEKVTRQPGGFAQFKAGLDLLKANNIPFRLKAMLLQSNIHEFQQIKEFCDLHSKDYFRYDHKLNMRIDHNAEKNAIIKSERIAADKLVEIEKNDPNRLKGYENDCEQIVIKENPSAEQNRLFQCNVGKSSIHIGADGFLRLCSTLYHPYFMSDLRKNKIADAYKMLMERVQEPFELSDLYKQKCGKCKIVTLCQWCPAEAYLETGALDGFTPEFCELAHKRYSEIFTKLEHSGIE